MSNKSKQRARALQERMGVTYQAAHNILRASSEPEWFEVYRRVWSHMQAQKIGRQVMGHEMALRVIYMRKRDTGLGSGFMVYDRPQDLAHPAPYVRIYRDGIEHLADDRDDPDPEHAEGGKRELFSLALGYGFFQTWWEWHSSTGDDLGGRWFRYYLAAYKRDGINNGKGAYLGQALTSEECALIREEHDIAVEYAWSLLSSLGFANRGDVDTWSRDSWQKHETYLAYARTPLHEDDVRE